MRWRNVMNISRPPLTEAQLHEAAGLWLSGRSWRSLWKVFQCHPKYLQTQAKRLGYMAPDTIRTCPVCRESQLLQRFTRAGAGGAEAIMHECNGCAKRQQERQKLAALTEPLLDTVVERLRLEAIFFARAHLAKARARLKAMQITQRLEQPE